MPDWFDFSSFIQRGIIPDGPIRGVLAKGSTICVIMVYRWQLGSGRRVSFIIIAGRWIFLGAARNHNDHDDNYIRKKKKMHKRS